MFQIIFNRSQNSKDIGAKTSKGMDFSPKPTASFFLSQPLYRLPPEDVQIKGGCSHLKISGLSVYLSICKDLDSK